MKTTNFPCWRGRWLPNPSWPRRCPHHIPLACQGSKGLGQNLILLKLQGHRPAAVS